MKFTTAILALFAGVIGGMTAANPKQEGERLFALKVKPVFQMTLLSWSQESSR